MYLEPKGVQKILDKKVNKNIECRKWHSSIVLEGQVNSYDEVYTAGVLSTHKGYKGVVNKLKAKELNIPSIKVPKLNDKKLEGKNVDVLVIGGGIIGCSILRELSKYDISLLLVEKECDLAMQASSRNDGMIHPGIQPKPGTKKAYFNSKGNAMYTEISKELDVPFRRSGEMILFNKSYVNLIKPFVMDRARKNGVEGVRFLSKKEVKAIEPNVIDNIKGALYLPTAGVIPPYKMTIAYGENAVMNGAEVALNTVVSSIKKENNKIIEVNTNRGTIYPKVVIDAAGVFADEIADMAGDQFFTIHPRKGEIVFLDNKKGKYINSIVAMPTLKLKNSHTKGGGLIKTYEGNVLIGPDAYEQPYKEDYSTNREHINALLKKHLSIIPKFSPADVITYCAGVRASTYEEDFIVEKSEYVENMIYAAGIQSPGFASAPAISKEIEKLTCEVLKKYKAIKKKQHYNPVRKGIPDLKHMNLEERSSLIKQNPDYGVIVCRCEEISKGEIIDALKRPIPVETVDGVKRRVRAGMGRCQGGFCTPQVVEIISRQKKIDMLSVTKKGSDSYMLTGKTKTE